MAKPITVDEAWIKQQVQLEVIKAQVTESNLEDTKARVLRIMLNDVVRKQLWLYQEQRERGVEFEMRRLSFLGGGRGVLRRREDARYEKLKLDTNALATRIVDATFTALKSSDIEASAAYWINHAADSWEPLASRPLAPSESMTPLEAEHFVTHLMLYLGAKGARTTQLTQDGGLDCESDKFAVQVKHLSSPVGVATVREIFAVGAVRGKAPIVFSKSGFTLGAKKFAIDYNVLLFSYTPLLEAHTFSSGRALDEGLGEPPSHSSESGKTIERVSLPSNRSPKSDAAFRAYRARQNRW